LLLVSAGTIVLMYFFAAKFFGRIAGVVAAASYGLLSTSASVRGLQGHATHFVVLAAIAGLLLLLYALDRGRAWLFFLSGVVLGLAFLMKQPGIFFAIFAGLYLLRHEWARPVHAKNLLTRSGLFALGFVMPYGLTCLILWRAGVFGKFWFWTFSYASHYGIGFARGFQELGREFPLVVAPFLLVWLLAMVGLTALWWNAKARRHRLFCLGFLLFSFLAVCPGFRFTQHYFILLLPAISLLVSVAVSSATSALAEMRGPLPLRWIPALAFLLVFAFSLFGEKELLFETDPSDASGAIYGMQPFREAVKVGEYLRSHSDSSTRIAVFGSEPEIYFYAHRHSATGYIYAYPLIEDQPYKFAMQQEMISEVEAARPQFIVLVNVLASWFAAPPSEPRLWGWMQPYLMEHYEVVGVADIQSVDHTEYRWGQESSRYQPLSPWTVFVFRRKS
jgi:hypothetical protein